MYYDSTTTAVQETYRPPTLTVGLDLSDMYSSFCILDADGAVAEEGRVRTTTPALQRRFSTLAPCRVVLEVGTHSPWLSRLLLGLGHEVIVANARAVRLIAESVKPMESIDSIKIVQVDGLTGGGSAADTGGAGGGNLADNVVTSALRYRAQAPLVDQLLAEIGINGKDVHGLTAALRAEPASLSIGADASAEDAVAAE